MMGQVQDILLSLTGARTVPRVFVDGKCIGGGVPMGRWEGSQRPNLGKKHQENLRIGRFCDDGDEQLLLQKKNVL